MRKTLLNALLLCWGGSFLISSALAAQSELVLVSETVPAAPIIVAPAAERSGTENMAMNALKSYLDQISGKIFQIRGRGDELPERAIVIGVRLPEVDGSEDLPRNGFTVRRDGNRLYLSGGSDLGLAYGVFQFLEHLGCRWWANDAEDVPSLEEIAVGDLDLTRYPPFDMHDLMNLEASRGQFQYKVGHGKPIAFTANHNLCPLLRPYAEENPEFLPMNAQGERRFNNLHMNYTAEGMPEVLATELGKEVEKRGGDLERFIYFAGMGDWYGGMDLSEESRRIYEEETWIDPDGREKPGYTATLLRMINRTAEILEKEHPGIKVGTFAYMSLEAPPAHTTPRDNVYIWLPRLRHDTVRSIHESEHNQSFLRNLERWTEIAPNRVYIWEYGANYHNFLMPFPSLRSIAENIRIYAEMGVAGVMIQGNYVSMGGDLAALKNWVWGKLLWDPTLDVDALIAEFAHGYYGPAGPAVIEYVDTLENFVREPEPIKADEFRPIRQYITDEMLDQLEAILRPGMEAVADDPVLTRRVNEAYASVEAARLWSNGPVEEVGGKMIRTDIGEYTWERALWLVDHLRGASPREWGTGRSYHLSFLSWHGGPVANLSGDRIAAKLIPVAQGRAEVFWDGNPVISATLDQPSANLQVGMPVEDFGDDNAALRGDLGVGHWSPQTKQELYRRVQLEGEVLHFEGTLQQRTAGANFAEGKVAVVTRYPLASAEGMGISFQEANGDWTPLEMTGEADAWSTGETNALRVHLPALEISLLDSYHTEGPCEATVSFDEENKEWVVTVQLPAVELHMEEPVTYLQRTIEIVPAPGN